MMVKELIGLLNTMDPESRVVVRGYESGVNDVLGVDPIFVKLDANTEYYFGQHESTRDGTGVLVVHIWGTNQLANND